MNILVTGGNGFIGSSLIKKLHKEGHNVTSIDDLSIGVIENQIDGVTYIHDDVNNLFNYPLEIDVVYHLAALSRIQPSYDNPTESFIANSLTTQIVCDWSRLNGVKRVIYSGSSSRWHNVYQSPYACYKHIGEEICKMYRKSFNLDTHVVRFYNVYGPGEIMEGEWAAVIGKWRQQINDGQKITIVGDGEQRRDFTHVDDIVDALFKIMTTNNKVEDAWELGTGENYSINEVADMFKERFDCETTSLPDQDGNYRVTLRERDDALDLLSWKPEDKLKNYITSL